MSDLSLVQPPQSGGLIQAEEQRAVQEVQAALVIAKRFPRDVKACLDKILNACSRPSLAGQALYSYARGGTEISGPSIRLAETMAQNWGNIDFGFRELARGADAKGVSYSEVQAFAWDMESNTRRNMQFRVPHWRDTRNGGYEVKEERDIYELVANHSQRRVRACILAVIPGDISDDAKIQCEATLAASADTSPEAIAKMVDAFAKFKVTKGQIEKRIQRRLDAITPAQVVNLKQIYTSLRDGMSEPKEWFEDRIEMEGEQVDLTQTGAENAPAETESTPPADEAEAPIEEPQASVPVPDPNPEKTPAEGRQKKDREHRDCVLKDITKLQTEGGKDFWAVILDIGKATAQMRTFSTSMSDRLGGLIGEPMRVTFTHDGNQVFTIHDFDLISEEVEGSML